MLRGWRPACHAPRSADTDKKTNTRIPGEDREMTRRIWAALIAAVVALALAVPVLADHDGGVNQPWVEAMNHEPYWEAEFGPGAECTKFQPHNGYIPAGYEAAVSKAGTTVRVYNPAPDNDYIAGADHKDISWVMKCDIEEQPEVPNLCDPADKPGGKSIGQWLAESEFEAADCFEFEAGQACGSIDATLLKNLTPYDYKFVWNYGDTPDLDNAQDLPAVFAEDEGDGSVEVTYYVVGPEADYFVGFGIPNFWEGGQTVTVDTDCVPEGTTTTTTIDDATTTTVSNSTPTSLNEIIEDTPKRTTTTLGLLPFTGPSDWLIPAALSALGMAALAFVLAWMFRDRLS